MNYAQMQENLSQGGYRTKPAKELSVKYPVNPVDNPDRQQALYALKNQILYAALSVRGIKLTDNLSQLRAQGPDVMKRAAKYLTKQSSLTWEDVEATIDELVDKKKWPSDANREILLYMLKESVENEVPSYFFNRR